jgi:hypothetical protein
LLGLLTVFGDRAIKTSNARKKKMPIHGDIV